MIGKTLSHYRLLEQLGAGGMGVVYRARDERLERDVAIKLLPAGALADDVQRRRFHREALALSRLNHPGIATVHEFDREGGADFIVMELVAGETLAARLGAGGLTPEEVIAFGVQIAEALEAAHERGVLHRDLKPANIVVTAKGRVKVLDFGLAKLVQAGVDTRATTLLTVGDAVAGTLAYMAPEQLLGEEVDAKSDLFALGVVLYEMATGQLPWRQTLSTALVNEILRLAPPAPTEVQPDLPVHLERVILKALAKDPAGRHASAAELAADLRAGPGAVGPAGRRKRAPVAATPAGIASLAVLPLENLSGDPEQEFFADGMTEALIGDLAQIGALRVISRTSAMQYKGARKPLPEIARALAVDAIVTGSVLRAGDRVRITAQLIDAASDRHLWAKSYERSLGDVLALQSEVARAIADEIRVKVTPHEQGRLARPRPVSPEALDAYLRGRYHWNRRTVPELRRSIEHFARAIALEPGYALAHAGLADGYNILGDMNFIPPQEAAATARAAAQRALELDESLAEAHVSLGFARFFYDWDWAGAEAAFRRALALNANYATGHQWFAEYLNAQGLSEEALREARRAMELDPLAFIIRTTVADVHFFARRYDQAIEELHATIELEPGFVPAHSDLGRACAQAGRHDDAIAAFERAAVLGGSDPGLSPGLAHAYALAGRRDEAGRILSRLLEAAGTKYISAHAIATVYTGLGDRDRALEWLERGYRARDRALVWLKVHPRLDSLRDDPRFADLLRRMKLADGPVDPGPAGR